MGGHNIYHLMMFAEQQCNGDVYGGIPAVSWQDQINAKMGYAYPLAHGINIFVRKSSAASC